MATAADLDLNHEFFSEWLGSPKTLGFITLAVAAIGATVYYFTKIKKWYFV